MSDVKLNPQQERAVETIDGPLLIVAGAGSGKTRVITHRIARMLDMGIPQQAILALTFTNKAAREMMERVRRLVPRKLTRLVVGTFHAFGVRILREYHQELGYRRSFSIYDRNDQRSLLRNVMRERNEDPEDGFVYEALDAFSRIKTQRSTWADEDRAFRPLYDDYNAHLRLLNSVDFDDLIALPIDFLSKGGEAAQSILDRFRYVLVDEFQDTSSIQYDLLRLLALPHRNVCVVGDDDQSIYSWRGANYENLRRFERDFPERVEIMLEQNYRSTGTILSAANTLIANNQDRKDKKLWTGGDDGSPIILSYPDDENEEATAIVDTIRDISAGGRYPLNAFGILLRTNAMSRAIEEALLSQSIPYQMSGGTGFFQRPEIRDLLAYLRTIANPDDDVALLRIINVPRRGIGRRTLERITEFSEQHGSSIHGAVQALLADDPGLVDLRTFADFLEEKRSTMLGSVRDLSAQVRRMIDEVDYWSYLVTEHRANDRLAKWKYHNLEILCDSIRRYESDPDNKPTSLFGYLNRVGLITRDEPENEDGKVNVMTIHAAKGLEFEVVFIPGCEDGIIPHGRSLDEGEEEARPARLEEERRLFYVAMTRAKERLYLSACRTRNVRRNDVALPPSPFLQELPGEAIADAEPPAPETEEQKADFFAALRKRVGAS